MTNTSSNLRKAAVLMRSLDADTAATLLAQFSPAETAAIRSAIRTLGAIDPEEQADVLAEFRRVSPLAAEPAARGVELALTSTNDEANWTTTSENRSRTATGKRFEFLEHASIESLVSYLAREHAQTIAVVLSHLAPARAASVLAALPEKLQADTVERLSALGETDPESVSVLERELAAWVTKRAGSHAERGQRRETIAAILAAADAETRGSILANLKTHKAALADQVSHVEHTRVRRPKDSSSGESKTRRPTMETYHVVASLRDAKPSLGETRLLDRSPQPPTPPFDFDHLIHLDSRTLAEVLREADSNVLALALAGSRDELVDRICDQMPKRIARSFRRELRKLGPTRLSDVAAAQRAVADIAAQQLVERQGRFVA